MRRDGTAQNAKLSADEVFNRKGGSVGSIEHPKEAVIDLSFEDDASDPEMKHGWCVGRPRDLFLSTTLS